MIQISNKSLYSKIPQSFVTRFCAYNLLRYQASVYGTIGPLVFQKLDQSVESSNEVNCFFNLSKTLKCLNIDIRVLSIKGNMTICLPDTFKKCMGAQYF